MPRRKPTTQRLSTVKIKAGFEGKPDSAIETFAYLFDHSGRFLDSTPLKSGAAQLKIDPKLAPNARIFLAPPLPETSADEAPTLKMMQRMRAYEPIWKYDDKLAVHELLPIPETLWRFWHWCICRVLGRVVKPVEHNDITEEMPVCHARVHICEVDPFFLIIQRLPERIIFRLRDEWIKEIERPPHIIPRPQPDPPPFAYNPSVIDPTPAAIAEMNRDRFTEMLSINPQPEPPGLPQAKEFINFDLNDKAALMSTSSTIVRQALLEKHRLIYPYLCYWPWFWPFLRCDEIAVLETDSHGRFDTNILYLCDGDKPDLYFWVEYFIGGVWTNVYKPPRPCHVYWNYTCGSEVTLRVTDPRVPWCEGSVVLPGKQVAVLTIGNNVSIPEIQGSSAGANEGLTTDGRPFGAKLEPHVWFGEDLIPAGITHYRWSYQRITEGDGSTPVVDSWHIMDRQVIRHYAVIGPAPEHELVFNTHVLGPETVGTTNNLFQIQSPTPPPGSSGWTPQLDARENTASAFFLSHLLEGGDAEAAAGKYKLKLELFDNAGNRVNLDNAGVALKIPTDAAPFGQDEVSTELAANEYRIKEAGKTVAFCLVLRIDNNPCEAEIYTIGGPDLTPNPNCGFVQYAPGADAEISFKAKHRNGFADFRFRIHRGTGINIPEAAATGLVSDTPINGYNRDPNYTYTKDIPVTTLLTSNKPGGSTDCDKAAFAETLDVDALATDGWSQHLWHLDATATPVAFALEPEEVEP